MNRFSTVQTYQDRAGRAAYVWDKYQSILRGRSILDVGADACHLRACIDPSTRYLGIDVGGTPDVTVDLERQGVPYADGAFDVVVCTEVLEHVDNLHAVFDDLCRVARRHVILSLPNPLSSLWMRLHRFRGDRPDQLMKFYGLPVDRPADRHKWFFSAEEAEAFVRARAARNHMQVAQLDFEWIQAPDPGKRGLLRRVARRLLLRRELTDKALYASTLWAVLEKAPDV